ncbi:conserved Plasmodium protein, unknown function [Plasmodium ovale]|uniref:Uncharacterized protein n=2 Tax=Plasmodium ovale TaxID=36330 RepID=A0A1A8W4P5_PLAOA|nr:conserved Plasmodium protein, unknown function [Plasmodium ovale curtisi]SBS96476.1 conserved Plasmodium protein, unknown function [Plasmodium ovale curtisi]SCP05484.1 conserved Plasmodium protein, unknown function [Plasmodium ovale]
MGSIDANELIFEECECEDTQKENKIKIANGLVKNYCLLKELNLLSAIQDEEKNERTYSNKKNVITYDVQNIIYANKYIMDFLQLKEQNVIKIKKEQEEKEEERRKDLCTFHEKDILNENDMANIMHTLNENGLNLSVYEKNIMNCDELNNFRVFNDVLLVKHIDMPAEEKNDCTTLKIREILKSLIKNYNNSLNLIKIQQNVINDMIFYTHNLLMNNKKLTEKNENLIKLNSVNMELKSKLSNNTVTEIKLPIIDQENISSLLKTQVDLYRKHINHLYDENNDLKKYLSSYNGGNNSSNS